MTIKEKENLRNYLDTCITGDDLTRLVNALIKDYGNFYLSSDWHYMNERDFNRKFTLYVLLHGAFEFAKMLYYGHFNPNDYYWRHNKEYTVIDSTTGLDRIAYPTIDDIVNMLEVIHLKNPKDAIKYIPDFEDVLKGVYLKNEFD